MKEYKKVRDTLAAIFSIDTGLSEASQTAMLERALQNPEWRTAFSNELLAAATDTQISWIDLLSNSDYEVFDASTEDEARDFGMSLLWPTTFPGKPVPQLSIDNKR